MSTQIQRVFSKLAEKYPEAMASNFKFRSGKVRFKYRRASLGVPLTCRCAWWQFYGNPRWMSFDDKILVMQALPALVEFVKLEHERLLPLEGTPFKRQIRRQAEFARAVQETERLFES
jgi:hypothetical protein